MGPCGGNFWRLVVVAARKISGSYAMLRSLSADFTRRRLGPTRHEMGNIGPGEAQPNKILSIIKIKNIYRDI